MYIGIDVGGTNLVAGVVDEKGTILAKDSQPTMSELGVEAIIENCLSIARNACEKANITVDDVFSIGIGLPGAVDSHKGEVIFCPNIPFKNIPLSGIIRSKWNVPVRLFNDANAAAYGEAFAGSARDCSSMVLITLGTGIGGGVVIDGKLLTGVNDLGSELGHTVIVHDGIPCHCGRRGCWEKYASATGLIALTKEYMVRDKGSVMWKISASPNQVDGQTAFAAARKGDISGKSVVDAYLRYLACGLSNIVNIFQPEVLCIGGGISGEGEYLLEPLKKSISQDTFRHPKKNTQLRIASLGNDAGIVGAALANLSR